MNRSNEWQLEHDLSRAEQARSVLDSAVLADAFATLERSYLEAWRASHVDDTAARENCFLPSTSSERCAISSRVSSPMARWRDVS